LGTFAVYGLPIIVVAIAGFLPMSNAARGAVWAAALVTMGAGCVVNALRCGRVHCYATGPFFLLMAAVAVFYGLGMVPLGPRGWNTIALVTLIGGVTLYYLPEALFGKYRQLRR
jgi:hypothetical protein